MEQQDVSKPQNSAEAEAAQASKLVMFPDSGGNSEDNPLLKVCEPIDMLTPEGKEEAAKIARDMITYLKDRRRTGAPPAALAANQLGWLKNVIVRPTGPGPEDPFKVLVNTEITEVSKEEVVRPEVCLSAVTENGEPRYVLVKRPASMKVQCTDLEGNAQPEELHRGIARAMWQEIDHTSGKSIFNTKGTIPNTDTPMTDPSAFGRLSAEYREKEPDPVTPTWIPYSEYVNSPDLTLNFQI